MEFSGLKILFENAQAKPQKKNVAYVHNVLFQCGKKLPQNSCHSSIATVLYTRRSKISLKNGRIKPRTFFTKNCNFGGQKIEGNQKNSIEHFIICRKIKTEPSRKMHEDNISTQEEGGQSWNSRVPRRTARRPAHGLSRIWGRTKRHRLVNSLPIKRFMF